MSLALSAGCGLLGLVIGSFLNVVIYRVPRKESLVRPRSRCPGCETQLAERDNVPVISWLLLRGRCRACGEPISVRYPLVELATATLFVAAALRFGSSWALPGFLLFFSSLLAISVIDLDLYIIPNRIVYPTLMAGGVLLILAAVLEPDLRGLRDAGLGALIAWGSLFVIHVISPAGMGFGDVRLSAVIGLFLGWLSLAHVLLGLFLGFLLASVVGIALILAGRRGRKDRVPFGPFLAGGAVIAVLAGDPLLRLYLGG